METSLLAMLSDLLFLLNLDGFVAGQSLGKAWKGWWCADICGCLFVQQKPRKASWNQSRHPLSTTQRPWLEPPRPSCWMLKVGCFGIQGDSGEIERVWKHHVASTLLARRGCIELGPEIGSTVGDISFGGFRSTNCRDLDEDECCMQHHATCSKVMAINDQSRDFVKFYVLIFNQ